MRALDYEEITVLDDAVSTLTTAKIDAIADHDKFLARIIVYDFPVAWREDGGTPTGATVQQLPVKCVLELDKIADMRNFKAIAVGGHAKLAVTYYG